MTEKANESNELLRLAADKIRQLRHENEILHAKVSTMELFASALHGSPAHNSRVAEVDLAWQIDLHLQEAEK